jgi:hypothetical protein
MPGSTNIIATWRTSRGWVSTVPTWLPRSGGDGSPAAVIHGAVTGSRISITKSADDPNGIKLGIAKRGGYSKVSYLQSNNFTISTLFRA